MKDAFGWFSNLRCKMLGWNFKFLIIEITLVFLYATLIIILASIITTFLEVFDEIFSTSKLVVYLINMLFSIIQKKIVKRTQVKAVTKYRQKSYKLQHILNKSAPTPLIRFIPTNKMT